MICYNWTLSIISGLLFYHLAHELLYLYNKYGFFNLFCQDERGPINLVVGPLVSVRLLNPK